MRSFVTPPPLVLSTPLPAFDNHCSFHIRYGKETSEIVSSLCLNTRASREMDLLWLLIQMSRIWGLRLNGCQACKNFTSQRSHSSLGLTKREGKERIKRISILSSPGENCNTPLSMGNWNWPPQWGSAKTFYYMCSILALNL